MVSIDLKDWKEYAVTIKGAVLPTSLTYLENGEWGSVEAYGFAYYPVIA